MQLIYLSNKIPTVTLAETNVMSPEQIKIQDTYYLENFQSHFFICNEKAKTPR